MAGYGTAICLARQLGHDDVADILGETLSGETATEAKLTELAESVINRHARPIPRPEERHSQRLWAAP